MKTPEEVDDDHWNHDRSSRQCLCWDEWIHKKLTTTKHQRDRHSTTTKTRPRHDQVQEE